jgi:hypothetical protein
MHSENGHGYVCAAPNICIKMMVYGWLIPEGSGGPLRFLGVGTFSKRCLNNVLSHPVCIALTLAKMYNQAHSRK